ncbi:MAG: recombinase family protein [Oscillospiraceae bacterium]|nr:recombinase family protein [Oscillospiraceae bacterium]
MPRVRKTTQTVTAKHWKIGIYIRLSREDKEKEEERVSNKNGRRNIPHNVDENASGSIVEQDKILTEWVEEYFREEHYEVVDYFVDDGLTGTDDTRDDFQRLIEYVEAGKVNCIVVKTLSRAFRNYADQGRYLEQVFPRLGVRFISSSNPFVDSYNDPDAINNGMEIPINGLMNDRFAAKTSADIRRTFDAKRRRGEFIGAFAPYGYIKDPEDKNSIIIDEEAAQHVRDIFNWFVVDGMSKRGIALKLNEMGVLNPTAYKQRVLKLKYKNPGTEMNDGRWMGSNILNLLKNEMYVGNMVQGRNRIISYKVHTQIKTPEEEWYVVEGTHEAIISRELFDQAQLLHSRDTRTAPGKKELYIFAGLLRCADCKMAMRRKVSKNLAYYHCRSYHDKGVCTRRSIREDRLIQAVYDAIRIQIDLVQSLSDALEAINQQPNVKTQSNRLTAMLKMRQADLDKVIKASDSLYMDWKNGDITKEDYRRMKASFDEKADELKAAVDSIKGEINTLARGVNADDPYLATFLKYRNITEINRGIVVELIDTIYVHEDGQITIDFSFADEMKRIVEFIENNQNDLVIVENKGVS